MKVNVVRISCKTDGLKFEFSCKNELVGVDGDKFTMVIPWSVAGFAPAEGNSIGLNTILTHYDTETKFVRVSISGNPVWHDVDRIYRISLS